MPGYDGKGPQGVGPNGRGLGPCGSGTGRPRRGFFSFGRVRQGMGRGFWWSGSTAGDEKSALKSEKEFLNKQMSAIDQRLSELTEK